MLSQGSRPLNYVYINILLYTPLRIHRYSVRVLPKKFNSSVVKTPPPRAATTATMRLARLGCCSLLPAAASEAYLYRPRGLCPQQVASERLHGGIYRPHQFPAYADPIDLCREIHGSTDAAHQNRFLFFLGIVTDFLRPGNTIAKRAE